jgi:hypothetical protein
VRRHIIRPLRSVPKGRVSIYNPPPKPMLQIDQHIRVSILLNQQASGGVSNEDRAKPFLRILISQQCVHLCGDVNQTPT